MYHYSTGHCPLLFTQCPTGRNTPAQPHFPVASATTDSNSRAKKLWNNPSGTHNTTQAVLQCGKANVTQDDQGLFWVSQQDTGESITLLTPAVARQAQGYTHREGGNKYIYKEFLQWMPRREKPNSIKTKSMQEQVWPVPWGAPTLLFGIWVLLVWLLMSGSCRRQLALACWLHADTLQPTCHLTVTLLCKGSAALSRQGHSSCLPFQFL